MAKTDSRTQLAVTLYDAGAFLDKTTKRPNNPDGRGFRLVLHETQPDAPLSPYFMNLRTADNPKPGPLTTEIVHASAYEMYALTCQDPLKYDCLAGVPNAGDPFADDFSLIPTSSEGGEPIPVIKLAKEEGPGGRKVGGVLIGTFKSGDTALVVDDLITEAGSKLMVVEVLRGLGLRVTDVVVLVNRQQGGSEELARHGIRLHSVFTITELVDLYVSTGRMSQQLCDEVKAYMAAARRA